MKQSECNNTDHDNVQLSKQPQQQQPQLPDHLKCGEVYTWKCAGELYAVECKLCEDQPLCPLSEFPQHMEVWHTDWEESLQGEEEVEDNSSEDQFDDDHNINDGDNNEDLYLSFTTEDSGLYEEDPQDDVEEEYAEGLVQYDDQHDDHVVEILEPFEQVLIEQDNNIDTIQINENEVKINEDKTELEQTIEVDIANDRQEQPKRDHKLQQQNVNNSTDESYRQEKSNEDKREDLREGKHAERDSSQEEDQSEHTRYHDLIHKELKAKINQDYELNKTNDVKTEKRKTRSLRKQNRKTKNNCNKQEISKSKVEVKVGEHEHETQKESLDKLTNDKPALNYKVSKRRTSKRQSKRKISLETEQKVMNETKTNDKQNIKRQSLNTTKTKSNRRKPANSSDLKDGKEKTENLEKSLTLTNKNKMLSLSVLKRNPRQITLKTKEKLKGILSTATNKSEILCDLEENFKDDFPKISNKNRKRNTRSNATKTNESDLKKNSYKNFENRMRTRRKSLRPSRRKLTTKVKIRRISETSYDGFENPTPPLSLENLKTYEHSAQNNLEISKISTDLESLKVARVSENRNSLTNMDIYSLLSSSSLENTSVTSYVAESSLYLSPGSFSAGSLTTQGYISEEDANKGNLIFNSKQQLNNLFDSCYIANENQPLTPQSPKTEEEHFEFYEPKEKLTKHHIIHLISLYKEHPRLWDQSHTDFCEPHLCRHSWQAITDKWNDYCQRKFTITEVRIRICTLCQRYLKECERLELEGELDESAKFSYYEEMQFLEQQKSLQKRRDLYEQQNEKVLEIFQHFPVLWHVGCYKLRQAKERTKAFQSISTALKLCGIHLSSLGVQKRMRSLKKCYRLEKIRHLHCQVEQTKFEPAFKHFERMQFLYKHIDPFICRICGKIFENLTQYREHLDTENHGSILDEDSESENETDNADHEAVNLNSTIDNIETPNAKDNLAFTNNMKSLENPVTNDSVIDSLPYLNEVTLYNSSPVINEVLIYPANSCEGQILNSLQIGDEIIEEIMENVSMNDSFTTQSLDNFINSVNNCEDITLSNCIASETLPVTFMDIEIPNLSVQNEIVIDPTMDSKISNYHNEIDVDVNQTNFSEDQGIEETETNFNGNQAMEDNQTNFIENQEMDETQTEMEETQTEMDETQTENNFPPAITVNVQCEGYSLDLKLTTNNENCEMPNDDDQELNSSEVDRIFARLPDSDIRKMIALYRKHPQLWDPNHLDFNSRNLRRQAWVDLTSEYCKLVGRQFSWRTLHRKLADYAKYFKKLITDQQDYEEVENKWIFFEDLKFLYDVIAVHDELQRSVHHRDNNFKIIGIYKSLPQLWDIKHKDFNKRPIKQRNIEQLCYRLQEEYGLQITPERLKNRLIELRAQYRAAKKQRLKSLKSQQIYTPEFEFYEALYFLDPHIDPFICEQCKMEFKKLTDFNQHQRREHEEKKILRQQPLSLSEHRAGHDHLLENICHICGIKFSTRSNLIHHVRRHEGVKNYECTLCTKKFFSSHSLKIHIRSHTKECPYTCEKCGISFVSASKLNQHVKRHSDKKDFACDYCPKTFFTAFERDRHVRRHLNIRDKVCPICGKSFVVGSSYYAHMMLHSDTKRFSCDKCDMKFAQYAGLYKHKKRHHKT